MTNVVIADDHPMFRAALRLAVQGVAPSAAIREAGTLDQALEAVRAEPAPDLILLDLRMPGAEGCSGVAMVHAERPDTPILVISAADARAAAPQVRAWGAIGFLSKSTDLPEIEAAVARALNGEADPAPQPSDAQDAELEDMAARIASLTPTQLKVLMGVLKGKLNKQIAWELDISEATVKGHMTALMRKMNVMNRTQAVLAAQALQLEPHV
ncbi:response regulator transcription factor [Sandaracinobacter neustonicus]|uniref:Response regulator transcription factor n=1 Tax=Sandaracinobacter neustonicus TaxID=1715348 RepID=A0A501XD14_9SPHN|nr:response regulator transcription factor [Sandaracinobacter neustonicus]TPE58475.1 response regulator transcription factor [Sandaracinobacter neustonicus]